MTKAGRVGAVLALALVFSATWFLLDRSEGRPRWLKVEAPEFAFVGRPLEVRVTLADSVEPARVVCTLHRAGRDRRTRERIASAGPAREAAGTATHTFVFDVPDRADMVYVAAVVYLSPTGDWPDRTRAAHTRMIPVRREPAGGGLQRLRRTPVFSSATAAEESAAGAASRRQGRGPAAWDHTVLFVLLLAAAAFCGLRAGRGRTGAPPADGRDRAVWLAFSVLLAAAAVLELSGIVGRLVDGIRGLARMADVYNARKALQKGLMAAVAAAGFGLFLIFLRAVRRPGPHRYLWWAGIGLALYFSVSFVSLLSFHAVDSLKGVTWAGVSAIDGLRLLGGVISLGGAAAGLGATSGKARGRGPLP